MALFGKNKKDSSLKETKQEKRPEKREEKKGKAPGKSNIGKSVVSPRVTEKTTALASEGVYVFDVTPNANKRTIKEDIVERYKVTPTKIRIVNSPKKAVFFRGIPGTRGGGKKAFVYLKKADRGKITIA